MARHQKVFWSIMEKAAEDGEFRAAVIADARSAIDKEFDIQIPESINIVVHENDTDTVHLPLPAKPEVLSEGKLRQTSGGWCNSNKCAGCAACI